MKVLLECARVQPDAVALRRAAETTADWQKVLDQAGRHAVTPLLHWRSSRCCPEAIPPAVAKDLEKAFHANVRRNLAMAAELRTVLGWLEAEGIAAIAYKGPTLAAWVYENIGLRQFNDLDILINPGDRELAISTLVGRGCRDKGAAGGADLTGNCEIGLTTPNGCDVDLHWDVSPPYFLAFDTRRVWDRVARVPVAGSLLPTFDATDLFACLAVHGARHCWSSLGWICDVANLVRVAPLDWGRALANGRTRRISSVALLLAADLLSAPVPVQVLAAARGDRVAAELARQIADGLFQGPSEGLAGTPAGARMHIQMAATVGDKIKYVWLRALEPNQTDNDFLHLSPRLRPLLYLIRPFRILTKVAIGHRNRS